MKKRHKIGIVIVISIVFSTAAYIGYNNHPKNNTGENQENLENDQKNNSNIQAYNQIYNYLKEKKLVRENSYRLEYKFSIPRKTTKENMTFEENIEKSGENFLLLQKSPLTLENGNNILGHEIEGQAILGEKVYYLFHDTYFDNQNTRENYFAGDTEGKWKVSKIVSGPALRDATYRRIKEEARNYIDQLLIFLPEPENVQEHLDLKEVMNETNETITLQISYQNTPSWIENRYSGTEGRKILDMELYFEMTFRKNAEIINMYAKGFQKEKILENVYKTGYSISYILLNPHEIELKPVKG